MSEQWRTQMFWTNYRALRAHGVDNRTALRIAQKAVGK